MAVKLSVREDEPISMSVESGIPATVDTHYNPGSRNAQAGTAVAEALETVDLSSVEDEIAEVKESVNGKLSDDSINIMAPLKVDKAASAGSSTAIAIGYSASANYVESIAIGYSATSQAWDAIAIGGGAKAADEEAIAIGNAKASSISSIAIGKGANAGHRNAIAIGENASASGKSSVAIGSSSTATRDYVISVGTSTTKRRIMNVAKPTADNDAATKAYVDAQLAYIAMEAGVDVTAMNLEGTDE